MNKKNEQLSLIKSKKSDRLKYYVAFSHINVRPLFKTKLLEYFDYDIERAYNVNLSEISKIAEYYEIQPARSFIQKRSEVNADSCFEEFLKHEDVNLLTIEDDNYPEYLKEIPDYPVALYYKGNIENIDYNYALSVVGSRNASAEAKIALNSIISNFKNSNITIISGLAYGIDATAHTAALNNNLRTIGVIGSGIDIVYPRQNKKLYSDIIEAGGAILSEYPLQTPPMAQNFPQRNRIVVGLSRGTLVGEARLKSGAMISANLALDFNRELMCIPGNILNPNTEGIYHLIRNGAGIVSTGEDLLNCLGWDIINNKPEEIQPVDDIQKSIMKVLELESKTFDDIITNINGDVSKVMVALTELELSGLIKQVNNKYYRCK